MKTAKQLLSASIMLLLAVAAQAQPGGGGGGFGDDPIDVPVDGGLSILAVAGIGYGMKRNGKTNKR